jgi:hypothetical protein
LYNQIGVLLSQRESGAVEPDRESVVLRINLVKSTWYFCRYERGTNVVVVVALDCIAERQLVVGGALSSAVAINRAGVYGVRFVKREQYRSVLAAFFVCFY